MSLAVIHSRAQVGLESPSVTVEVHLSNGLPALSIVGLPEAEVKEAKDRVRSAILNSQFEFPAKRITINLAPADLPKEGARFDLPIALGILAASGQVPLAKFSNHEFVGELALTGELRAIRGALAVALQTRAAQRTLVLPRENVAEARLIEDISICGASHLLDVSAHLNGTRPLDESASGRPAGDATAAPDLCEVKGQPLAKRALEIAAAGGHSLLYIGPPGSGKSMLAARLPGLLPPMTDDEALEAATIHSLYNGFTLAQWKQRPYRSPHHTASGVALVGGGGTPRPGEISLAHNGVLFLDELPEFDRHVLEVLREPLESGRVTISRAARSADFPARFQLIAAMNPCPCGYAGDRSGRCRCTPAQVAQYRSRLSGPLLDRIDMHVEVPALPRDVLLGDPSTVEERSHTVRERAQGARARMLARGGKPNSALGNLEVEKICELDAPSRALLEQAMSRLGLSARAFHRVLRVARTIADLAGEEAVAPAHVAEAIQYRSLDRQPA